MAKKFFVFLMCAMVMIAYSTPAFAAGDAKVADKAIDVHALFGQPMTSYGIIVDTFKLKDDAQTNFAAKTAEYYNAQTGNDLTNEVEQTFLIGNVEGYNMDWSTWPAKATKDSTGTVKFKLKGGFNSTERATHIITPVSEQSKIEGLGGLKIRYPEKPVTQAQVNVKVQSMLDKGKHISEKLGELKTTEGIEVSTGSDQKYRLDLTNKPAGTYVLNLSKTDFEKYFSENEKFSLELNDEQTIVLNVAGKGDFSLYKFKINGKGSGDWTNNIPGNDIDAEDHIIFNFLDAEKVVTKEAVTGTFFALNADLVKETGTSAGHIVAKSVEIINGEWHNVCHSVQEVPDIDEEEEEPKDPAIEDPKDDDEDSPKDEEVEEPKDDSDNDPTKKNPSGDNDEGDKDDDPKNDDEDSPKDEDVEDPKDDGDKDSSKKDPRGDDDEGDEHKDPGDNSGGSSDEQGDDGDKDEKQDDPSDNHDPSDEDEDNEDPSDKGGVEDPGNEDGDNPDSDNSDDKDKDKGSKDKKNNDDNNPKTEDAANIILCLGGLIAAVLGGILVFVRRRRLQ